MPEMSMSPLMPPPNLNVLSRRVLLLKLKAPATRMFATHQSRRHNSRLTRRRIPVREWTTIYGTGPELVGSAGLALVGFSMSSPGATRSGDDCCGDETSLSW